MATSACVRGPRTPSPNACAVRPRTPAPSLLRQPGPCLSSALPLPRVSAVAAPTPATDTAPVRHLQWPRTGRTLHGAYCTEFSQHSERNRPKLRAGALLGSTEPAAHRAAARGLAHRSALRPSHSPRHAPSATLRALQSKPSLLRTLFHTFDVVLVTACVTLPFHFTRVRLVSLPKGMLSLWRRRAAPNMPAFCRHIQVLV